MNNDLILYQKYEDLVSYAYVLLCKYPKSEKYALVSEIKRNLFYSLEKILVVNKSFNVERKLELINELEAMVSTQMFYVRFSYSQKYINVSNYREWSKRLAEIGKIMGGWYKYFDVVVKNEKSK